PRGKPALGQGGARAATDTHRGPCAASVIRFVDEGSFAMHALFPGRLLAIFVAALCALLVLPGGVVAAKPIVDAVDIAETGADICGVPTDLTLTGTETAHVQRVVLPATGRAPTPSSRASSGSSSS